MIDISNLEKCLQLYNFKQNGDIYIYDFPEIDASLKVDFKQKKLIYPTDKGRIQT